MPRAWNVSDLSSVGRVGRLDLTYGREGATTVLKHSRSSSPWHLCPPVRIDDTGCAYTWLVNPSGGLVGGDRVTVNARLRAGTHVLMTSPSANRVYRSLSEPAVQEIRLSVGPGARLEWLPEVTIPFAGSRFRQSVRVDVDPGATALVWDAMASGRVARGERWAFAGFENEIRIHTASGASVVERFQLTPGSVGRLARSWDYVAALYLISDAVDPEVWKRLEDGLAAILNGRPGLVLGGVSAPAAPGLAVKVLTRSASDLTAILEAMWAVIRAGLWGLAAPALRRY